jgi:CRP-like cAMP-binding protein
MLNRLVEHRPRPGRGARQPRRIAAKDLIHEAGDWGKCWRLIEGAVRLDDARTAQFVHLALPGELIGAEMLVKGQYSHHARALVACVMEPWPLNPDEDVEATLLHALLDHYDKQGRQLALRMGSADERVEHLLCLLTEHLKPDEDGTVVLNMPGLQDIADLTAQTMETASRSITKLRTNGQIKDLGRRQFRLKWAPTPSLQRSVRQLIQPNAISS